MTAEKEDIIGFFRVEMMPIDGSISTSFVNVGDNGIERDGTFEFEIGDKQESRNQPGVWLFDVDAPGEWTISIK